MYHVTGTGLTVLTLYLFSYFLYRQNLISRQLHKRIWNIVLAFAFILTAFAGLFLALQINYKWNIPGIKTILKWHVETGIGMALTGIFHFLWHLSYFKKILTRGEMPATVPSGIVQDQAQVPLSLFVTGFISISVQVLLIREIINIWGGYELVAGIFLGSWLIGSAAGSAMAARSDLMNLKKITLFFSISPLISIMMLVLLNHLFLNAGETPSFLSGIIFTFLVLLPFCLISGFTFVRLTAIARISDNQLPGHSFSTETKGGIAAGLLISISGSVFPGTYRSLLLIILLAVSYSALTYRLKRSQGKLIFKILVIIIAAALIITKPDIFFRQLLLKGIRVTSSVDTRFGNITTAEYQGETSTYYNQRLLTYSDDVAESEEDIHYAMLQTDCPHEVLLIGGITSSHIKELAKYKIDKIVVVEQDPALTRPIKELTVQNGAQLIIENEDAFSYTRNGDYKFDAAIALLPPPSSLLLNRYYTRDFFMAVKKTLSDGGIFACSPGINPNYFNSESVRLYSSIFKSLEEVFQEVVPIAGNKLYFIASDSLVSASVCRLAEERGIENIYVGPDYLSDDLMLTKSDEISSLMIDNIVKNTSLRPSACFYFQDYNLSRNLSEKLPSALLLGALFILPVFMVRKINFPMYFSAFSLAAFELILLLIMQITIGNMYQLTGLIIAGVMAGLATGSGSRVLSGPRCPIFLKIILLSGFYLAAGLSSNHLYLLDNEIILIALLLAAGFFPALVTGSVFRQLTTGPENIVTTSSVYNADLAGSALGFLIYSGLMIPLAGIKNSILVLPAVVFIGFMISLVGTKVRNF